MARTSVSDEEIQLRKRARRRLVGAIILVGIVVIAVPLVLDHAPGPSGQHVDVQMPAGTEPTKTPAPPDAAAQATPDGPLNPAAPAVPAPAAGEQAPLPPTAAAQPAVPSAPGPAPLAPPAAAPAEPKVAEPAPLAPPLAEPLHPQVPEKIVVHKPEAWAVQVIATESATKARDFKQHLTRLKFPVYLEKTPDGAKTRVRVGPYRKREAAEQARQRLTRLGLDPGKVVKKGE